jgi:hypothetical protein
VRRKTQQNARSNPTTKKDAFIEDFGGNIQTVTIKGTVTSKIQFDEMEAIARDWYTAGAMTITYTWADTTTTAWTGYVLDYNATTRGGEVDVWDYTISFAIGEER